MTQIKKYQLDDVIKYGKYEGETIRDIFQFDPNYLNWLITSQTHFYVDYEELERLPNPTPYKVKRAEQLLIGAKSGPKNLIIAAKLYIAGGGKLTEKKFELTAFAAKALYDKCLKFEDAAA
jgi:hypothetical protein